MKATDYKVRDMISPVIEVMANRFCKLDCGYVTEAFISHVDATK